MENSQTVNITVFFHFINVELGTKKDHLREVLIQYYILKKTTVQSYQILVASYEEHAPSKHIWFDQFCYQIQG